jgi:hypothetical protein
MASTYSPNLRIELIAVGEQANTWGGTTNNNLGTLIEEAISGAVSVDVTLSNVTLSALNGASDQSRQMIIIATGTPGVTRTITAPAVDKVYIVYNNSDAALSFIALGGTGVTLIVGAKKYVYCNGTNFYEAVNALTVTSGTIDGTTIGATTATTGKFTTINASGQITSTVTTGTAPFVVASTTAVANLTASNVSTNANLTGAITSTGNATILGTASFTSANLAGALTDETGSGSAVFATSPTLVTPALGTPSALVGTNITGTAASLTAGAVTNGVYTTGTQTIGGSKTFSSTVLLADGGVMFASDVGQDTGISWASDGVMNVRCNASTVGQFTPSGFTGNSATATNATNATTAANLNGAWAQMPAGTTTNFFQASAPTGWVQRTDLNDFMLYITSGAGGGSGGSASPLTMNVVPYHTHGFTTGGVSADHTHYDSGHQHQSLYLGSNSGSNSPGWFGSTGTYAGVNTGTGNAQLGGMNLNHTHSGGTDGGSSQTNWSPRYLTNIMCYKS